MMDLLKGIWNFISNKTLNEVVQNCRDISEGLAEKISQIPRAYACVHSKVPEGRMFCDYYDACCIVRCGICANFKNKY